MLCKVKLTKQNIQTGQGALVTGNSHVQLHTLTDIRRFKVLIKHRKQKEENKNQAKTTDPFERDL